jgi:hypothetical protein
MGCCDLPFDESRHESQAPTWSRPLTHSLHIWPESVIGSGGSPYAAYAESQLAVAQGTSRSGRSCGLLPSPQVESCSLRPVAPVEKSFRDESPSDRERRDCCRVGDDGQSARQGIALSFDDLHFVCHDFGVEIPRVRQDENLVANTQVDRNPRDEGSKQQYPAIAGFGRVA